MQRMKHVCEDNYDVLKDVREQINNRFAQLYNERKQETAKAKTNQ
jgi:hypothetical protein